MSGVVFVYAWKERVLVSMLNEFVTFMINSREDESLHTYAKGKDRVGTGRKYQTQEKITVTPKKNENERKRNKGM